MGVLVCAVRYYCVLPPRLPMSLFTINRRLSTTHSWRRNGIANGLTLMPFTPYWLSLLSDGRFPPPWGWETGLLGDGLAYQTFLPATSPLNADLAFDTSAVPVPERSGLIPLSSAVVGLASGLRRGFGRQPHRRSDPPCELPRGRYAYKPGAPCIVSEQVTVLPAPVASYKPATPA